MAYKGSHNSCASAFIRKRLQWDNSKWNWVYTFFWWLIPFFAKCQTKSIEKQLSEGVRLFDLRVSIGMDEVFYVSHTFAIAPLQDVLEYFFSQRETFILFIKLDFACQKNTEKYKKELMDLVCSFRQSCSSAADPSSSLQEEVFCLFTRLVPQTDAYFLKNTWYNTDKIEVLEDLVKKDLTEGELMHIYERIIGLYLTPRNLYSTPAQLAEKVSRTTLEEQVKKSNVFGYFLDFV